MQPGFKYPPMQLIVKHHVRGMGGYGVAVNVDAKRMSGFDNELSHGEILRQLDGVIAVAEGKPSAGPMAANPVEERFRWLTAVRSACIQTSRPHPGKTDNLDATFDRLFEELVL